MDILSLLEEMEQVVEENPRIPMTGKVVMEREVLMNLIDKMRRILPEEIRQGQWVTNERDRILSEAKNNAEEVLMRARQQADRMAGESEIVREANQRADVMVDSAIERAEEIKKGADTYAFEVLSNLEKHLHQALTVIKKGQAEIRTIDPEARHVDRIGGE